MSGPEVASNGAAQARTERVRTCWATSPFRTSPTSGPRGLRPRVGLRPTTPQQEAGMRMEPPPSPPGGAGALPAAAGGAGRSQQDGLRRRDEAELRRIRLAHGDQSGPLVAGDQLAVMVRDIVLQ